MSIAAVGEQIVLFDVGPDLGPLIEARELLMQSRKSGNTRKTYAYGWGVFARWCEESGRDALPASEETVSLFVTWSLRGHRYRSGTVYVALSAIAAAHVDGGLDSPVTVSVRRLVKFGKRRLREKRGGKAALTPELLRRLVRKLPGTPIGLRDRAMFLLTFAAGWRRSETASLDLSDVTLTPRSLELRLGASKTDQFAEGRVVVLPMGASSETCPLRALRAWLKVRGADDGPLFCHVVNGRLRSALRVSGNVIAERLAVALEAVGVDASSYGGHSLRSGMITAAAENGADVLAIMQRTGQRSVGTVLRYVRPAQAFRADPLRGVL